MKHSIEIIKYLLVMFVFCGVYSCTDENTPPALTEGELRLSATLGYFSTRLAELPNADEMTDNSAFGLMNVGVYIYYREDYENGDLSQPYVRNREFTVDKGQLSAVLQPGEDLTNSSVFIYDRMTVVAFYPYNPEMSNPENFFTVPADEEKYPITRNDYSKQFYIPYRAQTNTDPSIAYYTTLTFVPKHTYKVEIVLVSPDALALPSDASVQVLPAKDPVTNIDTVSDGKRAQWFDGNDNYTNDGSGSNVNRYTTYLWSREGNWNDIKRGEVLLQSDNLVLIASQDLYPDEQHVYRYGYNLSTGEIFIPTSSNLVYDRTSLSAINGGSGSYYQVCDIDLSQGGDWNPISIYNARYDGGGHQLSGMTINSTGREVGLFAQVQGNSTVVNANLVNPQITVNSDSAYVGGLVGRLNTPMTEAEKEALIGDLPPGLSDIVREALIQEILANAGDSEASIVASKVTNPTIIVNGDAPNVGSLVGQAGEKNNEGNSKSRIWDSGVNGGSLTVNSANPANNQNANVGGFVGLNQGYITRSYTSTATINSQVQTGTTPGGDPILADQYAGFANMGTDFTPSEGGLIESSYSQLADPNNGVRQLAEQWPSWNTYTGNWPVYSTGWFSGPGNTFWYSNGAAPSTYPALQWERR